MRILVLAPAAHDTAPGQRFRIEQWMRYLEPEGCEFTFCPFETPRLHRTLYQPRRYARKALLMLSALVRRLGVLAAARRHDLVLLHREAALIGPAVIERLLAALRVPLVYDFDDPIWLEYRSPTNGWLSRLKWQRKTETICRLAARVIAGNRLLGEWARQHAVHVDVVPSTIDLAQYPLRPGRRSDGPLTLGWTGSHSTLPFLDLLARPLCELAKRRPYRLLVISHTDAYRPAWLPSGVEVVARRWRAETEAADLADIDIGLGPFPDGGWTPWRCHGKVLQYMAAGIPCVASRLGILPDYIDDGVNGYLAGSDDEWIARLSLLIDDAGLRRRVGRAGRRTIEDRYAADVWAPRVRTIFESAAAGRRAAADGSAAATGTLAASGSPAASGSLSRDPAEVSSSTISD